MANNRQIVIAARRAEVAKGILARKPYRTIALELGIGSSTVKEDVDFLRTEWRKNYGLAEESFERALQDNDGLIAVAAEVMENATGADKLAAIDRLTKLHDQRNRLLSLYPRPGTGVAEAIPTGPIELLIQVIEPGNRQLITDVPSEVDEQPYDVEL